MSIKSNLLKAVGIGGAVTLLSAGAAFAAVATSSVNVRTGPGTSYGVVDVLHPGEYVNINGRSAGWCRVSKTGPDGWVSCAYLTGGSAPRVNVYPRYREPSVNFSFGFGTPYPQPRHHRHVYPRPWWW
jgi:uncharacterized protein YraI